MTSYRWGAIAVATALLVVFAGCSGTEETSTPSPTVTGTDTVDATTGDDPGGDGDDGDPGDGPTATPTEDPGGGGDGSDGDDDPTRTPTETPTETDPGNGDEAVHPPDPASDRLGWESVNGTGLWYNETIVVTREDGLNTSELDKVVARGMARVERVRELEFERTVPVEVISRAQFREDNAERFENMTPENRLHQNVKWEAMLMVGEDTDAVDVQRSTQGSTVGGYYSPAEERIVIVSENQTSPQMNEITLSQELFHGLQDQRFNITSFNQTTQELHNAKDGIIEGDGNLVDRLYQQRCEAEWDCLMPQDGSGGGSADIHFGQYLVTFAPYSDGPPFVRGIYEEDGWAGVNAVYENPPASTEQIVHPERYPDDEPAEMTFTDRSNDEWQILRLPNGTVDYASFGEAGMATMLFYPFYDSGRTSAPIIGIREFFNVTSGGSISSVDPINYANRYTTGWDGDRLYPYVRDDSMETNETGYVWKSVWDSEEDASEFLDGYEQLLAYHDANPVEGHENTYRLAEEFEDAIYVQQSGDTVFVVNAPTVEELPEVRSGAAPSG